MDIIKLLRKAYHQGIWNEADKELEHSFEDFLKENIEAINDAHCCESDSELLPKRLSNEAYTMARGTDHKTFTKWWDMQKV